MKIYEYISPVLSKIKELYSNLILNDTSNFNNNLSSNDDTVQKALNSLDDLSIPADVSDLTDTNDNLGKVKVDGSDTLDYLENQLSAATAYESIAIDKISNMLYFNRKYNTLNVSETTNIRNLSNAKYEFALINPSNQDVNVVGGDTTQAGRTVFIVNTGTTYNLNVYGTVIEPLCKGHFVYNHYGTMDVVAKLDDNGNVVNIDKSLDTSNFNNNLSSSDDTIQKAFDTLDDLTAGSLPSGNNGEILVYSTATNEWIALPDQYVYFDPNGLFAYLNLDGYFQVDAGDLIYLHSKDISLNAKGTGGQLDIKDFENVRFKDVDGVNFQDVNYIRMEKGSVIYFGVGLDGEIHSKEIDNKPGQDAIVKTGKFLSTSNEYLGAERRIVSHVYEATGPSPELYGQGVSVELSHTLTFDANSRYIFELEFYAKYTTVAANLIINIIDEFGIQYHNLTVNTNYSNVIPNYNLGVDTSITNSNYRMYKLTGVLENTDSVDSYIYSIQLTGNNSIDVKNFAYFKAIKETQ